MKKPMIAILFILALMFAGCEAFTGISQAETEDTFYVITIGGDILKCKRFGMRMVCIHLKTDQVDLATYRRAMARSQQTNQENNTGNQNFSPVPVQRNSRN